MTRGSDTKPLVRVMTGRKPDEIYVVSVKQGTILIRPFKARKGSEAEVEVAIPSIYERALMNRVAPFR